MHETVKKFQIEGVIADCKYIPRVRTENERLMWQLMRDKGYVPDLDKGTHWSTKYYESESVYEFLLTLYGVYVGRRRACEYEGMMCGRLVPKNTSQPKQPPF
jgi:hypothetical protein